MRESLPGTRRTFTRDIIALGADTHGYSSIPDEVATPCRQVDLSRAPPRDSTHDLASNAQSSLHADTSLPIGLHRSAMTPAPTLGRGRHHGNTSLGTGLARRACHHYAHYRAAYRLSDDRKRHHQPLTTLPATGQPSPIISFATGFILRRRAPVPMNTFKKPPMIHALISSPASARAESQISTTTCFNAWAIKCWQRSPLYIAISARTISQHYFRDKARSSTRAHIGFTYARSERSRAGLSAPPVSR